MITLVHSLTYAVVNPDGAWLSELGVGSDQILFPQTILTNKAGEQKARGGMHVCLPNFGPGGDSGLAQHGFGRTSTWSIIQQEESSVVMELSVTADGYSGLHATLEYRLENSSLTATLALTNRGSTLLRVAPGFHPYFNLEAAEEAVTVNNEVFLLNELTGTEYRKADRAELVTRTRHITMPAENLTTWAIWTDQLGDYVCVEPTFGGNRFLDKEKADERLAPGDTRTYAVSIHF